MNAITTQNERLLKVIQQLEPKGWRADEILLVSGDFKEPYNHNILNSFKYSKKKLPDTLKGFQPKENEWWKILCFDGTRYALINTAPPWIADADVAAWMGNRAVGKMGEVCEFDNLYNEQDTHRCSLNDEIKRLKTSYNSLKNTPNKSIDISLVEEFIYAKFALEYIKKAKESLAHIAAPDQKTDEILDAITFAYKAGRLAEQSKTAWLKPITRVGMPMRDKQGRRSKGAKNKLKPWQSHVDKLLKDYPHLANKQCPRVAEGILENLIHEGYVVAGATNGFYHYKGDTKTFTLKSFKKAFTRFRDSRL